MTKPIPFRFAPVPHEMLFDHGVPPQVIQLWAAVYRLWDLAGGSVAIGQTELGEKLGWSDDTVSRWARKAQTLGWLVIRRRGQGLPNEYAPLWSEPAKPRVQTVPEPANLALESVDLRVQSSYREKSIRERKDMAPSGAESAFEAFWADYPKTRRLNKRRCHDLFVKASKEQPQPDIAAGLAWWLAYWRASGINDRFIPHSSTWLNERRWETDPGPGGRVGGPSAGGHAPDHIAGQTDRSGESGVW